MLVTEPAAILSTAPMTGPPEAEAPPVIMPPFIVVPAIVLSPAVNIAVAMLSSLSDSTAVAGSSLLGRPAFQVESSNDFSDRRVLITVIFFHQEIEEHLLCNLCA